MDMGLELELPPLATMPGIDLGMEPNEDNLVMTLEKEGTLCEVMFHLYGDHAKV